jgi:ABC-type phosphate transport system substrate-binding protein
MKKVITTFFLLLFYQSSALAEIFVVVNPKNPTKTLEQSSIQDIYMGRRQSFPNNAIAFPIDHVDLRADFYQKLTGRPIEQINAYWARIMFSGQASPPMILPNDEAIIKAVADNPGAIGYVSNKKIVKNLHVIGILK